MLLAKRGILFTNDIQNVRSMLRNAYSERIIDFQGLFLEYHKYCFWNIIKFTQAKQTIPFSMLLVFSNKPGAQYFLSRVQKEAPHYKY